MADSKDYPILPFATAKAWEVWLERHHASAPGIWLRFAKKGSTPSVTHPEALDIAIQFGWIDGLKRSDGEFAWLQKFTPRAKRSIWSKINRDKALALIAAGKMSPAGLAEVERAQADGRWDAAYDRQKDASTPDFEAALAASPSAAAFYATLTSQNRYAIHFRVQTAKKPETRARRVAQFIKMLEEHKTLH